MPVITTNSRINKFTRVRWETNLFFEQWCVRLVFRWSICVISAGVSNWIESRYIQLYAGRSKTRIIEVCSVQDLMSRNTNHFALILSNTLRTVWTRLHICCCIVCKWNTFYFIGNVEKHLHCVFYAIITILYFSLHSFHVSLSISMSQTVPTPCLSICFLYPSILM